MFLVCITIVMFLALVLAAAMRPAYSVFSISELKRRAKHSKNLTYELERQRRLGDIETLLKVKITAVLVITILLLVVTFGWFFGVVLAFIVAITYPAIARLKLVKNPALHLYDSWEPALLRFVVKFKPVFEFLHDAPFYGPEQYRRFDSREELAELISDAKDVLSDDERQLIGSALMFGEKTVGSVMTPKNVIDSIKKSEFLGPLVLHELASLGHSRLPVTGEDIHQVVGILHLRDMLSLDVKRSLTAEKAMDPKVYYIHQEDTLEHALAAFLRTRHHLFIVINDERETVGLVTLEDVIESLIGRRIVDEDDIHADLRAVAKRQGKLNNSTPGHVDL